MLPFFSARQINLGFLELSLKLKGLQTSKKTSVPVLSSHFDVGGSSVMPPADSTAVQRTRDCVSLTQTLNSPGLREVMVRICVSGQLGESHHLQWEVAR